MVKGDVVWPLCFSKEGVIEDSGDVAIERVGDPEGWEEGLGEGVGSSNPGIGALQGVEVFYDCRGEGVLVCAEYVACPCDHL